MFSAWRLEPGPVNNQRKHPEDNLRCASFPSLMVVLLMSLPMAEAKRENSVLGVPLAWPWRRCFTSVGLGGKADLFRIESTQVRNSFVRSWLAMSWRTSGGYVTLTNSTAPAHAAPVGTGNRRPSGRLIRPTCRVTRHASLPIAHVQPTPAWCYTPGTSFGTTSLPDVHQVILSPFYILVRTSHLNKTNHALDSYAEIQSPCARRRQLWELPCRSSRRL